MRTQRGTSRTRGIAALEFALVMPLLVTILVGLWEVGRLIQLQQMLSNAAREGARLAAQSQTINSTGTPTQISLSTGSPNVKQQVVNYLKQAGLNVNTNDVTVTFAFTTGDTTKTQPYQGTKGQRFRVTVELPISSLRWTALKLTNVVKLTSTVNWTCLVDDPFTIDTTIPSW
ncbi:MAG: TadE/TadG family type IV pilus assembly protein [Gemmataceae bacterium]